MVSVIVYNKIVTSFKATVILKISQLKVKFPLLLHVLSIIFVHETVCIHGNYQEFFWLNLNNATHVAFSQVLI